MTGQTTALTGATGAVVAVTAAEPLSQVFNELGLLLAIMGALGGAVNALANRFGWREGLRGVALGALVAFGFGVLSPDILSTFFGINAADLGVQKMAGAAFCIGLAQETIISWLTRRRRAGR